MRLPSAVCAMAVGALMVVGASAQGAHQLAYSKSMGVTVFAEGGAQWCDRQLRLTIDADNAGFFQSADLQRLLQVLGTKVLASDCALAEAAQIEGRYQGATVWQGITSKRDGWTAQEMAAEKPAAVELPAGQMSPQAAVEDVNVDEPAAAVVPAQQAVVEPPPTEAPTARAPVQPSIAEPAAPAAPRAASAPEIATTPAPATEAVAAAKAAVAAADFAVAGWTPEPVLKQAEGKLDSVATKDGRCAVHYSARAKDKELVYLESDLPCVDGWIQGSGKALIKRVDGKQIAQMKGNFSRGFFTAQDDLDPGSVVGVSTEPPNNLLVLLKTDKALRAYYVGNVAVIGANRWGLCHYAQVRLVTEDQDLFLDEAMIDTVVENAAELVSRVCPTQRRFRFSAGANPWDFDKQDHNVNYYVTQVHQDRRSNAWSFNKSRAWNGVIAARIAKAEQERLEQQRREREEQLAQQRAEREAEIARQAAERQARQEEYRRQQEQQRAEQAARMKDYQEQQARYNKWRQAKSDYDRLAGMGGVARLAYLANTAGPRFPLDLYAEQVVREKPVNGAVLVRVSDDESDHSEVDWPVAMRLEDKGGVIDDEGVYFVIGQVTGGERRDEELPIVTMAVEKAWLCKERLCNDHGDVLGMVKTRHDLPDFDPEQQPEQPRWR